MATPTGGLDLAGLIQAAQLGRSLNPEVMQQQALGNQLAQQLQQLQIAKAIRDQEDYFNPGAANTRKLIASLSGQSGDPLSGITVTEGGLSDVGPILPNPTDVLDVNVRPASVAATPISLRLDAGGQPTGFQFDPTLYKSRNLEKATLDADIDALVEGRKLKSYAPGTLVANAEQLALGTGFTVPERGAQSKPLQFQKAGNKLLIFNQGDSTPVNQIDIAPEADVVSGTQGIFVEKTPGRRDFQLVPGTGPTATGAASNFEAQRAERNLQSIAELKDSVSEFTVGPGSLLSKIPGTAARDFKEDVDTLKANIAFSELQAMRAASKTGGALGQVAVRELELLQSALGALGTGQSPENFLKNLEKIESSITKFKNAQSSATPQGQVTVPTVNSKSEYDALPPNSEYIEDGKRYRKP